MTTTQNRANVDHDKRIFRDKPTSTIAVFCDDHNISRAFFYKLQAEGKGPRLMKIGRRILVSAEAAAEWRARMEAATPEPQIISL